MPALCSLHVRLATRDPCSVRAVMRISGGPAADLPTSPAHSAMRNGFKPLQDERVLAIVIQQFRIFAAQPFLYCAGSVSFIERKEAKRKGKSTVHGSAERALCVPL